MPYIIIAALIAGFGGGYFTASQFEKATHVAEMQLELKKQKDEIDLSHAADIEYIKAQKQQETVVKTITKEVVKYVPKIQMVNSDCNLTVGTQRLLDNERLQTVPSQSTSADTRSSEIREIELIQYSHKVMEMYNAAKLQCNSLIEIAK